MNNYTQIIKYLLEKNPGSEKELVKLIRKKTGELKTQLPKKSVLLKEYHNLLKNGSIEKNEVLENLLKKRAIRTLSGVAPITVMTAPMSCPKNCLYCPTEKNMPKSYLSNQPAAMRAVLTDFDPFRQTTARIRALKNNGHSTDKIEIIVNGGTWSAHPKYYQAWYLKRIFDACNYYEHSEENQEGHISIKKNDQTIKNKLATLKKVEKYLCSSDDTEIMKQLLREQKVNETATNRVIGITLETRPDYITPEEVAGMRILGCTKVEIGVQTLYPEIMDLNNRDQTPEQIISATKLMKDAGLKVAYHMMPGMYGSTPEKDIAMFKTMFEDQAYKPDFLKIYPCVVVKESELYEIYKQGKFQPYETETLVDTLIEIKKLAPTYTRISRLARDIPAESIAGGCNITNIRELVRKKMTAQGFSCQCIRCKEPKTADADPKTAILNVEKFEASDTTEYFLSFVSPDKKHLFAFLRLRLPSKSNQDVIKTIPELKDSAIVRELHTYGKVVPLTQTSKKDDVQHVGFGKRLMLKAEELAHKEGVSKIAVISGIGVREYYRKIGYSLDGTYMVKKLTINNLQLTDKNLQLLY